MITFKTSEVNQATQPIQTTISNVVQSLEFQTKSKVEAADCNSILPLVQTWTASPMNPFLGSLHAAFKNHYPWKVSPDDVWLCIIQGFSLHVNANAERLRSKFVQHQGKLKLVHENNYVKGSPDNNWQESFTWFSDEIAKHIGETRSLIVPQFSTTGPIESAAAEIVLMESMSQYFEYVEMTMCGIPEITVLGTTEDWQNIRQRVRDFNKLVDNELSWWTDKLTFVLDNFIQTSRGNPDSDFWQSFYKWQDESGGPSITGWVNYLFPYLLNKNTQKYEYKNKFSHGWSGPGPDMFPTGISKVSFLWDYLGTNYDMEFLGGFVGAVQDPESLAIQPSIGWAVRDAVIDKPFKSKYSK